MSKIYTVTREETQLGRYGADLLRTGDLYLLDRDFRVLCARGKGEFAAVGDDLFARLSLSGADRGFLSLHLQQSAKENVLLYAKERPILVATGLFAASGLLLVAVPHASNSVSLGEAPRLSVASGLLQGPTVERVASSIGARGISRILGWHEVLFDAFARAELSIEQRLRALCRVCGCTLFANFSAFREEELREMLVSRLLGVALAAMMTARSGRGGRTITIAAEREGEDLFAYLEYPPSNKESLSVFDAVLARAAACGEQMQLRLGKKDKKGVQICLRLSTVELSYQGVKEPSLPTATMPRGCCGVTSEDAELLF